jgi:hypothetical protein
MSLVPSVSSLRPLALIVLVTISSVVCQTCYMPNGTANTPDYQPCHTGRVSMCCATNRNNSYTNICRSDDLCIETGTTEFPGSNHIWREGCTDPTWKDPACLKLCVSGLGKLVEMVSCQLKSNASTIVQNEPGDAFQLNETSNHIIITTCPDGSMCCGLDNTACCDSKSGVFILNDQIYSTKPGSASTTSSASASTAASSSTSTTASATSESPSASASSSHGRALGIGLGLGIGIPALAILACGTYFFTRRRRSTPEYVDERKEQISEAGPGIPRPVELEGSGVHEAGLK